MATNLRNISWLHPLCSVRDWVMDKSGLFVLKAKCKQKLLFRQLIREDAEKKKQVLENYYHYHSDKHSPHLSVDFFITT